MTSFMNIAVRVTAAKAMATMAALQRQVHGLDSGIASSNRQTPLGSRHTQSLTKMGNQLQWTGRMLQYNFSLPIAAAGAAAATFALQQDAAMTHVAKVYGDTEAAAAQFRKEQGLGRRAAMELAEAYKMEELEALDEAFTKISNHYGVQKKEVLEVAGAWAAAGQSGRALAESVDQTMQAVIIGDMQSAEATKALISIQAQYNLSSKELQGTLANLNSVENQTGASMGDLIVGFEKAAGTARSAGIETEQLAAYMAALVPATGSAASAGNALKTIFSRIMGPTAEATQVMQEMGLETTAMSWQSSTAAERLSIMSKEFGGLGAAAQNAAASVIASRWQVNRFDVIMREITNSTGYYQKALKAAEDQGASFRRMQEELNTVLESDPRALQRMMVILQNASVDIIQPLIPHIIYLAGEVAQLAQAFADLDPQVQKFVLFGLIVLAAIGPVVRYMGALTSLLAVVGTGLRWVASGFLMVGGASKKVFTPIRMLGTVAMGSMGLLSSTIFGTSRAFAWLIRASYATVAGTKGAWLAGGIVDVVIWTWSTIQAAFKMGGYGVVGIQAATSAAVNATTAAGESTRLKTMVRYAQARLVSESASEAARIAMILANMKIAGASTTAEQVQRTNAAVAGSQTRTYAELGESSARTKAAVAAMDQRLIAEASGEAARTFAVNTNGVARATSETASESQRTYALNAGSAARVAYEKAAEGQRVFVVNTGGAARVSSENAAEFQRVIAVSRYGVARFTTESQAQAAITALMAGASATRLQIETAEGANRSMIANLMAASLAAAEREASFGRTFMVEAGGVAQTTAERAAAEARLAVILAFAARAQGTEAVAQAEMLAIQVSYHTRSVALWDAYYAYLISLKAAYNAADNGIAAGSSGQMLAIESAKQGALVRVASAGGVARVATEAATGRQEAAVATVGGAARNAVAVRTGTALVATEVATGRALVATTGMTYTLQAGAASAGGGRLVAIAVATRTALVRVFMSMVGLLLGPWGLIIAGIIGTLYYFRDEVKTIFNNVKAYFQGSTDGIAGIFASLQTTMLNAFYSLPAGVQGAMQAVVDIVRAAALAVYEWFSYINPWAHHSPSLVENVRTGMDAVNKSFSGLSGIKKHTTAAYNEIKRFGQLTAKLGLSAQAAEAAENKVALKKAGAGQALGSYNNLLGILNKLSPVLRSLETQMNSQQQVVDSWAAKVDKATDALDRQQSKLDQLQSVVDKYQAKVSDAENTLSEFASAPLKGLGEMEDRIQRNSRAQTELRYEIMKMEEANGTYDDLRAKIDAVTGAQELLRGTQTDLRAAGAGSEILGVYDAEMKKLDEQRQKYVDSGNEMSTMQAKLEVLQTQAERLDLVKAMRFDDLQYQIDKAAGAMEEMSFEKIMAGIKGANQEIDKYAPKVDAATKAVERQQAIVNRMTAARDRLQDSLDRESSKLDKIKGRYDQVNGAIEAINSSISDVISKAGTMNQALEAKKAAVDKKKDLGKGSAEADLKKAAKTAEYVSPGLANFRAAGNADFPDPGGKGIPPRTDWANQTKAIENFAPGLAKDAGEMFEQINPFKPLMEKAKAAWSWIKSTAAGAFDSVKGLISNAFSGVNIDTESGGLGSFLEGLRKFGEGATEIIRDVAKVFRWMWELLGPEIKKIGQGVWDGLVRIWEQVGPELAKFKDLIAPLGEALMNIWKIAKPILGMIVLGFLAFLKTTWSVLGNVVGPLLEMIGGMFAGVIQVVRGFLKIFIAAFTGDWGMLWGGIKDVFWGITSFIGNILEGLLKMAWGVVKGMVTGILGFFWWLAKKMGIGGPLSKLASFVAQVFLKLKGWGVWLWTNVLVPIWNAFKKGFDLVVTGLKLWWAGMKVAWTGLKIAAAWLWENVLQPVWNKVKELWTKYVKPGFKLWWAGIKIAWSMLKTAAKWMWENVLKPVWNRIQDLWDRAKNGFKKWWVGIKAVWAVLKGLGKWLWDNVLKPGLQRVLQLWENVKANLKEWWNRIKFLWAALKQLGKWVWDNVLKPVWQRVVNLWSDVKGRLQQWWSNIKSVWNSLTGLGSWFKNNVMDPVVSAIKTAWNSVKDWLSNNKDMLLGPAKNIANGMIGAVNKIINGLNAVSNALPGVSFHIDVIREFADGTDGLPMGRRANRGFKTSGARAIVGEGKANHPEFVIPTDPTYRQRAVGLLNQAASKLGVPSLGTDPGGSAKMNNPGVGTHGIPEYGIGGWLGDRWNDTKSLTKAFSELPANVAGKIMDPALDRAESAVRGYDWKPVQSPPLYAINKIRGWTNDTDRTAAAAQRAAKKKLTPKGGGVAPIPGGGNLVSWKGGTFTKQFQANLAAAEKKSGVSINVMQGGFRPTTSYSGTSHAGDALDSQASAALIVALRQQGIASGDRTGLGNWASHAHSIPSPGSGNAAGSGPGQYASYVAMGGASQSLSSPWGLAKGGIAKARRGGVQATIAEAGHDEAVVPLPYGWENLMSGGKGEGGTVNIYGNLEFPNIKNGDDAEDLVEALKRLSGGE